jgi:hypothetical protein
MINDRAKRVVINRIKGTPYELVFSTLHLTTWNKLLASFAISYATLSLLILPER